MSTAKTQLSLLILVILLIGCVNGEQENETQAKSFELVNDFKQFKTALKNGDTLNIGVNLSMCVWSEYQNVLVTKSNDSLFVQLTIEKTEDKSPIQLERVPLDIKLANDLEKILKNFNDTTIEKMSSTFFALKNFKEDTILVLRTTSLSQRSDYSLQYSKFISELYPNVPELKPIEIIEDDEIVDDLDLD